MPDRSRKPRDLNTVARTVARTVALDATHPNIFFGCAN